MRRVLEKCIGGRWREKVSAELHRMKFKQDIAKHPVDPMAGVEEVVLSGAVRWVVEFAGTRGALARTAPVVRGVVGKLPPGSLEAAAVYAVGRW